MSGSRTEFSGNTDSFRREAMEAWFAGHGVPQLIADYTTERRMDARARPLIGMWLFFGTVLWWGTRSEVPLGTNLMSTLAVWVAMALAIAGLRSLRRRPMWWRDKRLETVEVFALGGVVAVVSGFIEGGWLIGLADGRNVMLGLGAIYLAVGLGLGSIARWGVRRLRTELTKIAGLVGRTLPTLLILVLFLMFASELWEAAHLLTVAELIAVVSLMALIAAVLVTTALRGEMTMTESADWETLSVLAASTPAGSLVEERPASAPSPLFNRERLNLGALALIGQLIQSVFVAGVVSMLLIGVGSITLPPEVIDGWIGGGVNELVAFPLLGERRVLSSELVKVAALLGSVVGLYFTGLAITDSAYRSAHFEGILDEIRELIAARAYYRAMLVEPSASTT